MFARDTQRRIVVTLLVIGVVIGVAISIESIRSATRRSRLVETLRAVLVDPGERIGSRVQAASSLWRVDADVAFANLVELSQATEPRGNLFALVALQNIGESAVGRVEPLLGDQTVDDETRFFAAAVLSQRDQHRDSRVYRQLAQSKDPHENELFLIAASNNVRILAQMCDRILSWCASDDGGLQFLSVAQLGKLNGVLSDSQQKKRVVSTLERVASSGGEHELLALQAQISLREWTSNGSTTNEMQQLLESARGDESRRLVIARSLDIPAYRSWARGQLVQLVSDGVDVVWAARSLLIDDLHHSRYPDFSPDPATMARVGPHREEVLWYLEAARSVATLGGN